MKKSIGIFPARVGIAVLIFVLPMLYGCDGIISSPRPRKAWDNPITLCAGSQDNWHIHKIFDFSINNTGNAFVIWNHAGAFAQSYNMVSGWDLFEISLDSTTSGISIPQICIDSSGNAIAVWFQYNESSYRVMSNRYDNINEDWGIPVCIDNGLGSDHDMMMDVQIATDDRGNYIAVWIQDNDEGETLCFNRYQVASGWGVASVVETGPGNPAYPCITMDQSGSAICVWEDFNNGYRVGAIRYVPNTGWGAPLIIDPNSDPMGPSPRIASDNSGNAIAVWTRQEDGIRHIWANRYNVGTGWGTAVPLEQAPDSAYHPVVAVNDSGNAIALWEQDHDSHFSLWAACYIPGTGWTTPFLLENSSESLTFSAYSIPCVAMNTRGDAVAAWIQNDGPTEKVYANHCMAGGEWTGAECISGGTSHSMFFPAIGIDDEGNAVAVWYQSGDSYYILWSNALN